MHGPTWGGDAHVVKVDGLQYSSASTARVRLYCVRQLIQIKTRLTGIGTCGKL